MHGVHFMNTRNHKQKVITSNPQSSARGVPLPFSGKNMLAMRRAKAALFFEDESHPASALAGSNPRTNECSEMAGSLWVKHVLNMMTARVCEP
jgi:hypothetical protein